MGQLQVACRNREGFDVREYVVLHVLGVGNPTLPTGFQDGRGF